MIEKSKILSIILISCVISSLFAISFSSTTEECECDLTEVELNIQTLNSTISDLNSSYNDLLNDYNDVYNLFLDMNSSLNEFGDINQTLIEINNTISVLNNSYNLMLENYNELLVNFTNYVNLLNSFGNITALIESINLDISVLQANITSLNSRINALESERISIPPLSVYYLNGWSSGSYNIQCMYALHSDNDARIDASFYVSITGYYKIKIIHASNTNNRSDDGLIYVGKMQPSAGGTVTNLLNGANFDLNHTSLNVIYQDTHSNSIYIESGSTVFCTWQKTEDENSGVFYVYGIVLVEV